MITSDIVSNVKINPNKFFIKDHIKMFIKKWDVFNYFIDGVMYNLSLCVDINIINRLMKKVNKIVKKQKYRNVKTEENLQGKIRQLLYDFIISKEEYKNLIYKDVIECVYTDNFISLLNEMKVDKELMGDLKVFNVFFLSFLVDDEEKFYEEFIDYLIENFFIFSWQIYQIIV